MVTPRGINPDRSLEALFEAAENNLPLGPDLLPDYFKADPAMAKLLQGVRNEYVGALRLAGEVEEAVNELKGKAAFGRLRPEAQAEELAKVRAQVGEAARAQALAARAKLIALHDKIARQLDPPKPEPAALSETARQTAALEAVARSLRVNDLAADHAFMIRQLSVNMRQRRAVELLDSTVAEHGAESEQVEAVIRAVKALWHDGLGGLSFPPVEARLAALRRKVLSTEEQARVDTLTAQLGAPAYFQRRMETRIKASLRPFGLMLPASPLDKPEA